MQELFGTKAEFAIECSLAATGSAGAESGPGAGEAVLWAAAQQIGRLPVPSQPEQHGVLARLHALVAAHAAAASGEPGVEDVWSDLPVAAICERIRDLECYLEDFDRRYQAGADGFEQEVPPEIAATDALLRRAMLFPPAVGFQAAQTRLIGLDGGGELRLVVCHRHPGPDGVDTEVRVAKATVLRTVTEFVRFAQHRQDEAAKTVKSTAGATLGRSSSGLHEFPLHIAEPELYAVMNLGFNKIREIPADIGRFSRLQTLILSNNRIRTISREIRHLSLLESLMLGANELCELPEELADLPHLSRLDVNRNQELRALPSGTGRWRSLRHLDITGCRSLDLAETFAGMAATELESLRAGSLDLYRFPPGLEQLISLRGLVLDGTQLVDLPEAIARLVHLETLSLSRNPDLDVLQAIVALRANPRLHTLYLNDCGLTELPEAISELPSLKVLSIPFNDIRRLPESMAELQELHTVNLSGNANLECQQVFEQLRGIKDLDFRNNPITAAVPELGRLTRLRKLKLSERSISPAEKAEIERALPDTEVEYETSPLKSPGKPAPQPPLRS